MSRVARPLPRVLRGLALSCVIASCAVAASAAEPPATPFPNIETGMHGAAINRIDVHAASGQLLTVSDDRTLRLWSLADGEALATVRVPAGQGNEGKLYAVAASPAGPLVAVSGWTGIEWDGRPFIYLVDRASGRIRGRVGPFEATVNHLAFSPDGRLLAAAFASGGGLKVFDVGAGKLALDDRDYGDGVTWAAFDRSGRLATASLDGRIRLYGADLKRAAAVGASGARPFSVAFSPDGERLAVGYLDAAKVTLHSARDLSPVATLTGDSGRDGNLAAVAFAGDGRAVYAGGTYGAADGVRYLRRWPLAGGKAGKDVAVGRDTVMDIRPLPDGRMVYATAEPSWGVIGPDGAGRLERGKGFADFRDGFDGGFRVSADGAAVEFGFEQGGKRRYRFDLLARSLAEATPVSGLVDPATRGPRLDLAGWRNGARPTVNGAPLALEDNETARSVAVEGGGQRWLLGTDYYLRRYDGGRLLWKTPVPGAVWAVNVAAAGRMAVVGLGDGTIRWLSLDDGSERLALFAHADGKRWIVWTPEGFFDHSPGGDRLFGYHLNRGAKQAGEFVDAAQLYRLFFRRDLVVKKLMGGRDGELRAQLAAIGDVRQVLAKGLPPTLKVSEVCAPSCAGLSPGAVVRAGGKAPAPIEASAPEVVLKVELEDRGGGIGPLIVRRNGATVVAPGQTRAVVLQDGAKRGKRVEEIRVALEPGVNDITVSATNAEARIEANAQEQQVLRIRFAGADRGLPVLHVLAVGINEYDLRQLALVNARQDAESISGLMRSGKQGLYREAVVTTLVDRQATLEGIRQGFARLAREVAPDDVVMVFLAGHGVAMDGQYYFLPADLPDTRPETIRARGLGQDALALMLAGVKASKAMLLVDTCFAGSLDIGEINRRARDQTWVESLSRSTGRFTLVGTTNEQEALDGVKGNGVFTGVVLEALRGAADTQVSGDRDGRVNVYELARYTRKVVPEEARKVAPSHQQEPVYHFAGSEFFDIRARE